VEWRKVSGIARRRLACCLRLAPYAHTTVHAKYWDRWKDPDVQRNVRIMVNNNYEGIFALEYEDGPWDGVEGAKYLYREVMAAL
jgi:hypothetical protein